MKRILLLLLLLSTVKAFAQYPAPTSVLPFISIQGFYKISGGDTTAFLKSANGLYFPVGRNAGGGTNIFNSDGTLTTNRALHNSGHTLKFDSLQVLNAPVNPNGVVRKVDTLIWEHNRIKVTAIEIASGTAFSLTQAQISAPLSVQTSVTIDQNGGGFLKLNDGLSGNNWIIVQDGGADNQDLLFRYNGAGTITPTKLKLDTSNFGQLFDGNNVAYAKAGSAFALTTIGTTGPATYSGGTLNIPQYTGGLGTVTSVAATGANGIGVSGSPITGTGTLAFSLGNITPTTIATTIKPATIYQTAAGTAGTDSIMVKHSGGIVNAISPGYYATSTSDALKLAISDTAAMLGNYIQKNVNSTIATIKTFTKAPIVSIGSLATTPTDGLFIQNPTAGVVGIQAQYSPYFHLRGQAYNPTSGVTNFADWVQYVSVSAGNPITSSFTWASSINTTGTPSYATQMTLTAGVLGVTSVNASSGVTATSFVQSPVITNPNNNSTLALGGTRTFNAANTAINLNTGAITNSSGQVNAVSITAVYNQTSTAAGVDLLVNRTETAVGSGNQRFFDFQVSNSTKMFGDNKGNIAAASVRGIAVTFANKPATAVEGMLVAFTDSTTATWGATITGSGSNHVLGYYDGTNWTVTGL